MTFYTEEESQFLRLIGQLPPLIESAKEAPKTTKSEPVEPEPTPSETEE